MATEIQHENQSLGIEVLDNDHIFLEKYLNTMGDAINSDDYNAKHVEAAFDELISQVEGHFLREEAWLKKEKYPGLNTHKRIHATLIHSVQTFSDEFSANPSKNIGNELFGYVKEWLVDHMYSADQIISGYINFMSKGRKH